MWTGTTLTRRAAAYAIGVLVGGLSFGFTERTLAQDFYQGKTLTIVIASFVRSALFSSVCYFVRSACCFEL